jgi:hypothetical protein
MKWMEHNMSPVTVMPESYRSTAEVWFEIVQASRKAKPTGILRYSVRWLGIHWKLALVAVSFWVAYGCGMIWWPAH